MRAIFGSNFVTPSLKRTHLRARIAKSEALSRAPFQGAFYSTFCETKGADTLNRNVPLAYYGAFQAPSLPNGPLQGALGTQSVLPTLALAGLRPAALLQSEAKPLSV